MLEPDSIFTWIVAEDRMMREEEYTAGTGVSIEGKWVSKLLIYI